MRSDKQIWHIMQYKATSQITYISHILNVNKHVYAIFPLLYFNTFVSCIQILLPAKTHIITNIYSILFFCPCFEDILTSFEHEVNAISPKSYEKALYVLIRGNEHACVFWGPPCTKHTALTSLTSANSFTLHSCS